MNQILIDAARHIEYTYCIPVNQNDPKLDSIIWKFVVKFETQQLVNYWKSYLATLNLENERAEIRDSFQDIEKVEKTIYYRGVKVEKPSSKPAQNHEETKGIIYRGIKSD